MDALSGKLPEGWRQTRLHEICEGIRTGPSGAILSPKNYVGEGVPLVRPSDIAHRRISGTHVSRIPEESASRLARYRIRTGDVLCIRTGNPGKPALVTEEQEGWVFSTHFLRLRPVQEVDPHYLVNYLDMPFAQRWIASRTTGSTTIRSITARAAGDLPVALPPLAVQREIGTALRFLDEKIQVHLDIARTTAHIRDSLSELLLTGAQRLDDLGP
ncbi:restriction endonuclease subunit S [Streptomyces sp. NPDC059637]|uniref:restriction endonuclease subunit S n=1 Tax=Streptomyces sp. NPDC059637 TaxID=3347752 RepID=UPI0036B7039D